MMRIPQKRREAKQFLFWILNYSKILNKLIWILWSLKDIMMMKKKRKKEGFSWKMPFIFIIKLYLILWTKLWIDKGLMEYGVNRFLGKKLQNFIIQGTSQQKMYFLFKYRISSLNVLKKQSKMVPICADSW